MAGEWIKMRTNLWDDGRVAAICEELDACEALVCGGLFRLWGLADEHSEDGTLPFRSASALNRKIGIPQFAEAVQAVGWLHIEDEVVRIDDFDKFNGKSAKGRALAAKRAANKRSRHAAVTPPSRTTVTETRRPRDPEPEPEPEPDTGEESPVTPSCPATALAVAEPPPVLVFPTTGKGAKEWGLTESQLAEWGEAYPDLDVLGEMRKAQQWVKANHKKTAGGMTRFLTGWLNRANDSGKGRSASRGSPKAADKHKPSAYAKWAAKTDAATDSASQTRLIE